MLWQKGSVNRGKTMGRIIASDRSGNSFVAGRFRDTLTLNGRPYVSGGQSDMFISKYDPDGNVLWSTVIRAGYAGIWPVALTVGGDGSGRRAALPNTPVPRSRFRVRQDGVSGVQVEFQLDHRTDIRLTAYDLFGRKLNWTCMPRSR
jgi:hypothetical protein